MRFSNNKNYLKIRFEGSLIFGSAYIFLHFNFYEQLKFHTLSVELSRKKVLYPQDLVLELQSDCKNSKQ